MIIQRRWGKKIEVIKARSIGDIDLYAKWKIEQYTITYNSHDNYEPKLNINLLDGEKLVKLYLGTSEAAALTSTNRLFFWGFTLTAFNTSPYMPIDVSTAFNLMDDESIIDVTLGNSHHAVLTSNSRVLVWGNNNFGQLGDGSNDSAGSPMDITSEFNLNPNERIIQLDFGDNYSSALSSDGRVFTWGNNDFGQLGDGTREYRNKPTDITMNFNLSEESKIVEISIHTKYSIARTSKGSVFKWGDFDNDPKSVVGQGVTISTGAEFFGAITSDGTILFLSGRNNYGQIMIPDFGIREQNEGISYFDISHFELNIDDYFTSLSLGKNHSALLTREGRLFLWGNNSYDQLGSSHLAGINRVNYPVELTSEFNLAADKNEIISQVVLGDTHSGILTSEGRLFMWGNHRTVQYLAKENSNRSKASPFEIIEISNDIYFTEVISYNYNDLIELKQPNRSGYIFEGWYTDITFDKQFMLTNMPNEDLILYAKWIRK